MLFENILGVKVIFEYFPDKETFAIWLLSSRIVDNFSGDAVELDGPINDLLGIFVKSMVNPTNE